MENSSLNIGKLLEHKSGLLFDKFKKIKNFHSTNYVCAALLKDGLTHKDVKNELTLIECTLSFKSTANSQVIELTDVEEKVVIFYATSQEDFDWIVDYHSYSNSILFGKIFKGAGFKFSDHGLQYQHKEYTTENHQSTIGEIDVCKDYKKILSILELSYSEYQDEINTEEEFFKFILKSPFVNPKKFVSSEKEFSNVVMINFEKYIILNNMEPKGVALSFEDVTSHFTEIDFVSQIKEFQELALRKKSINDKFNGKVILDSIPGYNQKDLGHSIREFKESFGSKDAYENFIISNTQEQIIEKFKSIATIA